MKPILNLGVGRLGGWGMENDPVRTVRVRRSGEEIAELLRDYWTPTTGKSPTTSPSSSRLPYPALALSPTLNPLHESSANTPPKPSKKICRTMSISENPVRRSDARPMRPAQACPTRSNGSEFSDRVMGSPASPAADDVRQGGASR